MVDTHPYDLVGQQVGEAISKTGRGFDRVDRLQLAKSDQLTFYRGSGRTTPARILVRKPRSIRGPGVIQKSRVGKDDGPRRFNSSKRPGGIGRVRISTLLDLPGRLMV